MISHENSIDSNSGAADHHDDEEMIGRPNWDDRDSDEDGDDDGSDGADNHDDKEKNVIEGDRTTEDSAKPEASGVNSTNAGAIAGEILSSDEGDYRPISSAFDSEDESEESDDRFISVTEEEMPGAGGPEDELPVIPEDDEDDFSGEMDEGEDAAYAGSSYVGEELSRPVPLEIRLEGEIHIDDSLMVASEIDPVIFEDVEVDDRWIGDVAVIINRWNDLAETYAGSEVFKTALVLPMFAALGYDAFNPEEVEPIESEAGRHEGYLIKGYRGSFSAIFDGAELSEGDKDKPCLLAYRDRFCISVWIETEDGEGRWESVVDMKLDDNANISSLKFLHREMFDKGALEELANQLHGDQEYILEAMRKIIERPGAGFVGDVRSLLEEEGHENVGMLEERISVLAGKLLNGTSEVEAKSTGVADEEKNGEDDDGKGRPMTPAEIQAFDVIKEICSPEISGDRIFARPGKAYLAVLLDDNNRKTIARLHFMAASKKYIGVFTGREETKHAVALGSDVAEHSDALRARAAELDPEAFSA